MYILTNGIYAVGPFDDYEGASYYKINIIPEYKRNDFKIMEILTPSSDIPRK